MTSPQTEYSQSLHAQTPLHNINVPASVANPGVVMREDKYRGHLNLRGNPEDEHFTSAVAQVLGVALPMAPNSAAEHADTRVYWLCPNEWLILVAEGTQAQVETDLRAALETKHVAVTDLSSGQTLVNLSGAHLDDLMMKSTVYYCHPSNFPVGKAVQTTFAKAGALMYKCEDGSFDLVIRRSFSDYFFLWVADASEEYGLQVV